MSKYTTFLVVTLLLFIQAYSLETHYDILGVPNDADGKTIKKKFYELAKKYHPDIADETLIENLEELISKINVAYEILSDPEKRKQYDDDLLYGTEDEGFQYTRSRQDDKNYHAEAYGQYETGYTSYSGKYGGLRPGGIKYPSPRGSAYQKIFADSQSWIKKTLMKIWSWLV